MKKKIKTLEPETGYNLAAEYYDEKEKYLNSFEQNKLMPLLGDLKGKRVLDVGAGTGRLAHLLINAGAKVTALDISKKMLEVLKRKIKKAGDETLRLQSKHMNQLITVVGDADSLPFEKETFDIVIGAFLIVHLRNPTRFFDEAYRVLKDDGVLVVTNINQKDPPLVKTKEGEIIINSYYHRPDHVIEILEQLAFSVEHNIIINKKTTEETVVRGKDVWINQIVLARK